MAAFKFFNIGKANEEVTRLESRVKELEAENAQLKDNGPAIEAEAEKLRGERDLAKAEVTQAQSDLATARQTISSVTAEKEQLAKDLAAANEKLAQKQSPSAQAAAIVAQIGVPPVSTDPNANPAATKQEAIKNLTGLDRAIAAHKSK